jgi:hypothetical protein
MEVLRHGGMPLVVDKWKEETTVVRTRRGPV